MPGKILRIDPKTCVGEAHEPPFDPAAGVVGYTPRGIDVDSNGVIWTALASSGHLASFDRRKCKGRCRGRRRPTANTAAKAGRSIRCRARASEVCAARSRSTSHYNFVDRHNVFGLGADVPFANGTNSDSLLALQPDGSWLVMRVPYPLDSSRVAWMAGSTTRTVDGRGAVSTPTTGRTRHGTSRWSRHAQLRRQVPAAPGPAGEVVDMRAPRLHTIGLALAAVSAIGTTALAHVDLSGAWGQRFHEDLPERGAGPEIGDYLGLPINAAARPAPIHGTRGGRCWSGRSIRPTMRRAACEPSSRAPSIRSLRT